MIPDEQTFLQMWDQKMNNYIIVPRRGTKIEKLCIIIVPSSVVSLLLFTGQNQPTNNTNSRAVEMRESCY
jgi:hypothetical protein